MQDGISSRTENEHGGSLAALSGLRVTGSYFITLSTADVLLLVTSFHVGWELLIRFSIPETTCSRTVCLIGLYLSTTKVTDRCFQGSPEAGVNRAGMSTSSCVTLSRRCLFLLAQIACKCETNCLIFVCNPRKEPIVFFFYFSFFFVLRNW